MKIALIIILCLIIFVLIHVLISQLDDLCEYEKKINKTIEYIESHIVATETEDMLLNILKGEDNE